MIKCTIQGVYVGTKDLVNRNGSTTKCVNLFVPALEKQFSIFRCEIDFSMGQLVELPCELRLRQDGSPYFVYSDGAQPNENKKS
ncbi:MAG: hypothetical protein E7539_01130 [Ruminococcaceae bacterium]|nr:hypothetical protein [Oscillospiraceae bacterium]